MATANVQWRTAYPKEPRGQGAFWIEMPRIRINSLLSDEQKRYIIEASEADNKAKFVAELIKLYSFQVKNPIYDERPGYRREGAPDFILSPDHPLYSFWEKNQGEIHKIQTKLRAEYCRNEVRAEVSKGRAGFLERVTWLVERAPIACFSLFLDSGLLKTMGLENVAEEQLPLAKRVWLVLLQGGLQAFQAGEDVLTRRWF